MKKTLLLMFLSIVGLLPAMGGTNYLEIPELGIAPGETKTLVINLVNDASFTAFQMNVHLPDGITINEDEYGDAEVSIASSRIADHSIISNYIDTNTLSIAAYSGNLRPFKGNSGAFLEITITANSSFTHNEDINVTNIIFTTTTADEYKFEDVSGLLVCLVKTQSVTLSDSSLSLTIGNSAQLSATVLPENATDKTVSWTSSNTDVVTVDANGKVTAVAVGTATITATCGSVSATCAVTVNPVVATSVALNKTSLELLIGSSETLVAIVSPDNTTDKTVTWTSSNADVATVDATGKVTAVAVGTATITATCGSVSATCAVTVNPIVATSVALNKTSLELPIGSSETLVATVSPDNTTDKTVTWTSSNVDVATVDATGKVTAVAVGTATITATCGSVSATCAVTVNPIEATEVALNKTSLELLIGSSETLTATVTPENTTDKTVTWESSDETVAIVNSEGMVTALAVGTATITATCGSVSATCEVTVKSDSGVENVSGDSFGIRVEGGEIVIEGLADDALVQVFTLDGKLVYSGYERCIPLQAGDVYIIVYPGGTRKVAL